MIDQLYLLRGGPIRAVRGPAALSLRRAAALRRCNRPAQQPLLRGGEHLEGLPPPVGQRGPSHMQQFFLDLLGGFSGAAAGLKTGKAGLAR